MDAVHLCPIGQWTLGPDPSERAIEARRPVVAREKQLNGLFRAWTCVRQADRSAPPVIWGDCIVHLANPEFSGRILHTSSVLEITEHKGLMIAETRNSYYTLLGPEVILPPRTDLSPEEHLLRHREQAPRVDSYASAAMNADRNCAKCRGTGVYLRSARSHAVCDACCKHRQGWWQLEGSYGVDNGRWACKAGCGRIVDLPPPELEFLPRAIA